MDKNSFIVSKRLREIASRYMSMDLGVIRVNCPYWMNKTRDGKVVVRGRGNGKGTAEEIRQALMQSLGNILSSTKITQEYIQKMAKRNKIGIDCSGFAYRILDEIIKEVKGQRLDTVFPGGINKTNANLLTSENVSISIPCAIDIKPADLIRMNGGKHIALVVENDGKNIHYIHSSHRYTSIKGAHEENIKIIEPNQNLASQLWLEKTPDGQNFGKKYFNPENSDAVRRLKILYNFSLISCLPAHQAGTNT